MTYKLIIKEYSAILVFHTKYTPILILESIFCFLFLFLHLKNVAKFCHLTFDRNSFLRCSQKLKNTDRPFWIRLSISYHKFQHENLIDWAISGFIEFLVIISLLRSILCHVCGILLKLTSYLNLQTTILTAGLLKQINEWRLAV